MKTYIQIEPNFIQTAETHADGSFTSGIIRRLQTKTRQGQDGTTETYSPWDELDPTLVTWLDVPTWQATKDAEAAKAAAKADRKKPKKVKGEDITLDDVKQGELAGLIAAAGLGASFPMLIESGETTIAFANQPTLEAFFLDFIAARQAQLQTI